MQQADKAVMVRDFLHEMHEKNVMVCRDIRPLEYGREFVLVRRDLVVARAHRDAEFIGLLGKVVHEIEHAFLYGSQVLVFQLLALG